MFNKDVLMKFIQTQQQKTQPVVSNEGFLNGAPAPGTNYRIPSDTLYNPTPHHIKAVSDNGIEAELQPYDETNVHFPGAQYVDEYEMPKAQLGLQLNEPDFIKPLTDPLMKGSKRKVALAEDSIFENVLEFIDPSGVTSWDDAKRAYIDWMRSGSEYPTMNQALSMFGAVPALGKFSKIKYLDPESIKVAYKYIPWQQIANFFDSSNDIQEDNMQRVSPLPIKKYGGLEKFLPKAQPGLEVKHPFIIPADADRYGVDAPIEPGKQWVDQDLVNRRNLTQDNINKGPRYDYEQAILKAIDQFNARNLDVSKTDYMPESVKQASINDPDGYGQPMYCISGVCYTINESNSGENLRYYSNAALQDDVIAGKVPNWKMDYDLNNMRGGDILQWVRDNGGPHHAGLIKPGSIQRNDDGMVEFTAFMNSGDGVMFEQRYRMDPKTDKVFEEAGDFVVDPETGEEFWQLRVDEDGNQVFEPDKFDHIQLITRDFGSNDKNSKLRAWLDEKITKQDPQFFTRSKGAKSRWQTYSPGMFAEKGKNWITMNGETVGVSTPTMMQNTEPGFQEASRLLTTRSVDVPFTDKDLEVQTAYDVDYKALSEKAGFNQILNRVNDEEFKKEFMKRYNISNREYNGIVSNTFGIYGQESGFGTKPGGFSESDAARTVAAGTQNLLARWMSNGLAKGRNIDPKREYSRGLTQVKLANLSDADMKRYGITPESVDTDPEKAFVAAMIANAQNLPELRKLAMKGETQALDQSNYLDFLPYLYSMPGRLRRGDKKTIAKAIDEGVSPEEAIVQNPNNTNNEYIRNVRTFANLFQHFPTTSTMEIKRQGGSYYANPALGKFIKGL
jgi:hypothetical protein